MKYATLSKSAFAVTAILIAVACSSSEDSTEQTNPTDPGGEIKGTTLPEGGTKKPDPEKKCPSSCTTNDQCANACPAVTGGVQCCSSNQCYPVQGSTCPAVKNPDGPDSGSAYPSP